MRKIYNTAGPVSSVYLFKLLCFLCILTIFDGCMKDDFSKISTGTWNPELAGAVINTKLQLSDFLKNDTHGFIKEDSVTHHLTVVYHGTPFSQKANDILKVDSQAAALNVKTPAVLNSFFGVTPKDTVITNTDSSAAPFTNANNASIETLKIKSGTMDIALTSDFQFSGDVVFTFPTFKNDKGYGISLAVPFNYVPGVSPTKGYVSAELANTIADMTNGGTTSNTLPVKYKLTIRLKKGDKFTGAQKISVSIVLRKIVFSYVDGYFGSLPLDMGESFPIDLFHYIKSGSLNLKDPNIDLKLSNSYGLPIDLSFKTLQVRTLSKESFPFTGTEISSTIHLPAPAINEVGQVKTKVISINPTTSNISRVISKSPVEFDFVGKVTTNPEGRIVGRKNFITDSSKASVDVDLTIPLNGTATGFTAQDTFPFVLSNLDMLESMTLKINTENGFPLDVDLQLYFADSLNHVLDSLILNKERFLHSGVVDVDGNVLSPTVTTITSEIDKARFPKIKTTKKILLKGVLNTTINADGSQSHIWVSSQNYLGVKLGVRTRLKIKI